MDLVQQYLQCYALLNTPESSKAANTKLLSIQASEQAWNIAHALISSSDNTTHLHGCQLLSKKLNCPPPATVSITAILQFLIMQTNKCSLLWLCIAKLLLHFNPIQSVLPNNLPIEAKLSILKEIPSAISQIRTEPQLNSSTAKNQYFELARPLIIQHFQSHKKQILKCLDSFVSFNIRINSSAILLKLLQQPIHQVGFILEQILLHETYPELQNHIISFLQANKNQQNMFNIHIAFYSNVDLSSLSVQQFTNMLGFIIQKLSEVEEDGPSLTDTFQFWFKLRNLIIKNQLKPQQIHVARSAFVMLWQLICIRAVLKQLPTQSKIAESSLAIDVDQDECEVNLQSDGPNIEVINFRSYVNDFIPLCFEALSGQQNMLSQLFDKLTKLCCGSSLQLQLGVFLLTQIADSSNSDLMNAKHSIEMVFKRQNQYSEYLCGKVIDLIGKLHSFFCSFPELLPYSLSFLAKTLNYQNLSSLASQSCCNLLQQVQKDPSVAVSQNIQIFLSHIYQVLFQGMLKERVIQNLTKAMVIFIFKFKNSAEYYHQFLSIYSSRISSQGFDPIRRAKYIQSAIIAQLWLNARQDSHGFLLVFESFIQTQLIFLLQNIYNANRKPAFTAAINLVNLAIKSNAVSNVGGWVQLVNQILGKYMGVNPPASIVLTPLVNLVKVVGQLRNQDAIISVLNLVGKWEKNITALIVIDNTNPKVQFILSNIVLQFHVSIMQLFIINNQYSSLINYNPQTILAYIKQALSCEVWQYQILKNSLAYYNLILQLGYPPEQIIINVFVNYGKIGETLWNSIEPILMLTYQRHGATSFLAAFKAANSTIDESNPIWTSFVQALAKSEGKTVKNILLSLS